MQVWECADAIRRTMNSMFGDFSDGQEGKSHGDEPGSFGRVHLRSPYREDRHYMTWRRLLGFGSRFQLLRRGLPTGACWRSELNKIAQDAYHPMVGGCGEKYVPFISELMAEPPLEAPTVHLDQLLPCDLASRYYDMEFLLQDCPTRRQEALDMNRRFTTFLGEHEEWVRYFGRPEVRPLWRLRRASEAKGTCSVAAVPKRTGQQLRKILMVCPFNWAVEEVDVFMAKAGYPFEYGLRGSGAITQTRLVEGDLSFSSADQSNAFTSVVAPESWWEWQAAPKIRARDLPTS